MKVIEPSYKIIDYNSTDQEAILAHLERCGRTCYKSEKKITDDSAKEFVQNLMKRKHEAMIEHASFAVIVEEDVFRDVLLHKGVCGTDNNTNYKQDWYSKTAINYMNFTWIQRPVISGNLRAWRNLLKGCKTKYQFLVLAKYFRNKFPELFSDITMPTNDDKIAEVETVSKLEYVEERFYHQTRSVRFICNRGFTHELVRMRPCSFAQESTRYCDYSGEVTNIRPEWLGENNMKYDIWNNAVTYCEDHYKDLRDLGCKPQEARGVLPIDVKTEIVLTTNLAEWWHIFGLRTANAAHPSMQQLMRPLCKEFQKMEPEIFGDISWESSPNQS